MRISMRKLVGVATLAVAWATAPTAHATLEWSAASLAVADDDGSGYVYATSIAVTPDNVPYIIDAYTGGIYYLGTQSCGGLCTTPVWIRDGDIAATFVGVTPLNDVFAFDYYSGTYYEDDSGRGVGFNPPMGAWGSQTIGGCLESLAPNWFGPATIAGQPNNSWTLVGTGCDPDEYGDPGVYIENRATPWVSLAGGHALQTAIFTTPDWGDGSLWAVDAVNFVYAYDVTNNVWAVQPGAAILIADHLELGTDGNVYEWDDSEPDPQPGQLIAGGWVGPVLGALPSGVPIAELAQSAATVAYQNGATVGGPSAIWAIDAHGNVWTGTTFVR
jgi:hypothetical protein